MGTWFTTREDVMSAQDIKASAYAGRDIDRAIEAGARACEALLHRYFAPWVGTRYFDVPSRDTDGYRLYLGEHSLISATAVTSGGTAIDSGDYLLRPDAGPPHTRIELDLAGIGSWSVGSTPQRAVAVTGLWAWSNDEESLGVTAEALDASETGIETAAMPTVGIGSIIRVDDERMIVTDKGWLTTGQTGTLAASNSAQALTVADGTAFRAGETLLLDTERVQIVDVAGNVLAVRRAVDGTTLAAHAGATIYAPRLLTVQRGALGTTAAAHLTGATAVRWVPPGPLAELNLAYAVTALLQRQSGYARTSGAGDNQREASGRAVRDLERTARAALGRQMRTAAA